MTETKKVCSKCGIEKSLSCFHRNKTNSDGLRSQCKDCRKEKNKDYYLNNTEAIKEKNKDYYLNNAEALKEKNKEYREQNKEAKKEYNKQYRINNTEALKEYYEQNKERKADYRKQYLQTEQGKMVYKINNQKRRALKKELPNTLTKEEWAETLQHFNHSCANCGLNDSPIHIDHFVPLSSGEKGTTATNCIPLCSKCNLQKGAKHPLDFFSKEKAREIIEYLYTRKQK